ncbi:MAG: hypothetical protein IPL40_02705 [Proteobacteria bacterium]|nr:hypothetical protein [Pseudomonadota bacterium]
MELRRDLWLGLAALVAFNLVMAFGTVGLMTRIGPAFDRALHDNVSSIEAAEQMLTLLAQVGARPASTRERQHFVAAMLRAQGNVTERHEADPLSEIERGQVAALGGDSASRDRVIRALRRLVRVNREALWSVKSKVRRLGTGGAWAAVILAAIGLTLSLLAGARLSRRILMPLGMLYATLEARRAGDRFRRCGLGDAPHELRRIVEGVNRLLDGSGDEAAATGRVAEGTDGVVRAALVQVLERSAAGCLLVDHRGEVLAANRQGLTMLNGLVGSELRQLLSELPSGKRASETLIVEVTAVGSKAGEGAGSLCTVRRAVDQPVRGVG